jgi:predicted acylesterase/phospholipase RssA
VRPDAQPPAHDDVDGGHVSDEGLARLRDQHEFGHARRLLARLRQSTDSEHLRQQHALCTYKDLEVSARRRLDAALVILDDGGRLQDTQDAETLGLAGAIHKRRWEVDGRHADLEDALGYYRRGFGQRDHPLRWYAGINGAFVADRLASLERNPVRQRALHRMADSVRRQIVQEMPHDVDDWGLVTLGEALFGLGEYQAAGEQFAEGVRRTGAVWRQESTLTQLAALAHLRGVADHDEARAALGSLVGGSPGALDRARTGKIGLALSGGGYRASLFHIGVLARLAECDVLRRVEVLSCVSGGSIVGAYYYLKLRRLLQETPDAEIHPQHHVDLVREVAVEFLHGVQNDLRGRLLRESVDAVVLSLARTSRSERAGRLFEQLFYADLREEPGPWRMPDLLVRPAGRGADFSLHYENWMREAKVPVLVLNATTLNTGHSWQFTASGMGEPPSALDEQVDASRRLSRIRYKEAPDVGDLRAPTLGTAVAASAGVPGVFPPVTLRGLYDGLDVELVDGGVHDNQGIASLLEQDCAVLIVSDASGQLPDDEDPSRAWWRVLKRSNDVLMKRVRAGQYADLEGRRRAGTLRAFVGLHLTKGLPAPPRPGAGAGGEQQWTAEDDLAPETRTDRYGFPPRVQRALAELRTDLDAFSDDEAYALMAAGYVMMKRDLPAELTDLTEDTALEQREQWPFWRTLEELTSADAGRLLRSLEPGRFLFLRRPRAWLRRRRAAPVRS